MEKPRYSDAKLEEFRKILLAKRTKAQKDLDFHLKQLEVDDTNDVSLLKGSKEHSNSAVKEENFNLATRLTKFIKCIDNALIRIDNKTYGVCRVTGKLIPEDRLIATPHATLSIEAKKSMALNPKLV